MVLNTLISLFYYLRVVVRMGLHVDEQQPIRAPVGGLALVNVCAVMLLLLFVFAHPLKNLSDRFARSVCTPVVQPEESMMGEETFASID